MQECTAGSSSLVSESVKCLFLERWAQCWYSSLGRKDCQLSLLRIRLERLSDSFQMISIASVEAYLVQATGVLRLERTEDGSSFGPPPLSDLKSRRVRFEIRPLARFRLARPFHCKPLLRLFRHKLIIR